jgi:hypothetical protein
MKIEQIKHRIIYGHTIDTDFNIDHEAKLTMVYESNLDLVETALHDCIDNNIEGDFIETGVWRGGTSIWAYNLLKQKKSKRKVYVYDSFEGCPSPDPETYPADSGDNHYTIDHLAVSLETVQENFKLFGNLDNNAVFVKGWFKDTMPINTIDRLCVMRLDGDLYESTIQVLDALYDKLSVGGYCIIDDWGPWGATQAVHDFRNSRGINDEIIEIPGAMSCYWKKS